MQQACCVTCGWAAFWVYLISTDSTYPAVTKRVPVQAPFFVGSQNELQVVLCGGVRVSMLGFVRWCPGRRRRYARLRLSVSASCHEPLRPGSGLLRPKIHPARAESLCPADGGMLSRRYVQILVWAEFL